MVAAIRQAAERHDILAILTGTRAKKGQPPVAGLYADPGGKPWVREWTGTEWSPFLQLHPDDTDPTLRQLAADVVRSGAGGPAAGVNPPRKIEDRSGYRDRSPARNQLTSLLSG